MALQYLRYVLSAAEQQSFRQAAIELGVWESTISRGIRDLEDEIGVALFIRHSGGVTLTNAGSRFLSHLRMAVGRIEYALKDAGAAGRDWHSAGWNLFVACLGIPVGNSGMNSGDTYRVVC